MGSGQGEKMKYKLLLILFFLPLNLFAANHTWNIQASGGDGSSLSYVFDHADTTISAGDTLFIDIHLSGVDSLTATKSLDGWTNSGVVYFRVVDSVRHSGVAGDEYYVLVKGFSTTLNIGSMGVVIFEGLQFRQGLVGSYVMFDESVGRSEVTFKECLFTSGYRLVSSFGNGNGTHWKFYNCLFKDFTSGTVLADGGCTLSFYNNTFANCEQAVVAISSSAIILYLSNNIAIHQANANGAFFSASSGGTWTFNYNITDDGTAADFGGTGNQANTTPVMVDTLNDTFLLAGSDTYAIDNGTTISEFNIDVQGDPRSSYDIGFDEYYTEAGGTETVIRWLRSVSGVWRKAAARKDYRNAP